MEDTPYDSTATMSSWYRGLNLTERRPQTRLKPYDSVQRHINQSQGTSRLDRWQNQKPFQQDGYFGQWLAQHDLDKTTFEYLLAEDDDQLQLRLSTLPPWVSDIYSAYADRLPDDVGGKGQANEQSTTTFLPLIEPLLYLGCERLQRGLQELVQSNVHIPFESTTVHSVFQQQLQQQLLQMASRTLTLEINVARLSGQLVGNSPTERFASFIQHIQQPEHIIAFFQEYPVLARTLTHTVEQWVAVSLEFLQRLCHDWDTLCTQMYINRHSALAEVSISGDTHQNGRAVIVVTFDSGDRVVYKPRSLAVDGHFHQLLDWINTICAMTPTWLSRPDVNPLFRTPKVIDCEKYGWMEYIEVQSCSSQIEIQRFYYRQGGYLALLYAIAAVDFHAENLIAAGEYPMLIDLETLFHPKPTIDIPTDIQAEALAFDHLQSSVLSIGLLPEFIWANEESEGVDMSGLGREGGQQMPITVPMLDHQGTDYVKVVHKHTTVIGEQNRPTLHGDEVNVTDYLDDLIAGFTDMYRGLATHRSQLLAIDGPLMPFADDTIRVILRPTMAYSLLLRGSFHPDVLRNAVDRDRFFDRLWEPIETHPYFARVIGAEQVSLWRGDIPMFTTHPGSCDLWDDIGTCIPQFFVESGLARAQARIQHLSEDDLHRQTWYIRTSVASLTLVSAPQEQQSYHLDEELACADTHQLMISAQRIGDGLAQLAWHSTNDISWIGVVETLRQPARLVQLGSDLYYGTPGMALFFAQLGRMTGQQDYTRLSQAAVTTIRRHIEQRRFNDQAIGAFEGWGGLIYTLLYLGVLWNDQSLIKEAETLINMLPPLIEVDQGSDVMVGSAGCLVVLLAMYRVTGSSKALSVAIQCGERLLVTAKTMHQGVGWVSNISGSTPLTGFSHGTAGIAWALLELASITGDCRFQKMAYAGLAYERCVFMPERQVWPDFRITPEHDPTKEASEYPFTHFWCHGSAGIGLSRIRMLQYTDDSEIYSEIQAAIKATFHHGLGHSHCLCHGDTGNLEFLLQASQCLNDHHLWSQTYQLATLMIENAADNGWLCGMPFHLETPGLMTGLAGIGYQLLRLADPAQVPSILTLDLPTPLAH